MTAQPSNEDPRPALISLIAEHDWDGLAALCRGHLAALEAGGSAPPGVLAWLQEASEQSAVGWRELAPLAARIGGAAEIRQAFRAENGDRLAQGTYVSLGCECHPWVILNRWGFRDSLRDINPFCLGLHRMPKLLEFLEGGFGLYAQPENLSTRIHGASGQPMIVDDVFGVTWNHHRGTGWTGDGFARFRAQQSELIGNYRASSSRPGAIHVISRWINFRPDRSGAQIARLLEAIRAAGAESPRLVILDFETDKLPPGIHRLSGEVQAISRPYPEGYAWPGLAAYNSPQGAEWERSVVSDLAELTA